MCQEPSDLEAIVVYDLSRIMEQASSGSELTVPSKFLSSLELLIPQLLSRAYPEWESESLDGFFLARVRKTKPRTAEFAGLCILISDQTVTPVFLSLTLSLSSNSIDSYQVFLGESGGGRLGISGPSCNSDRAQKMLIAINARLDTINWVYTTTNEIK